MSSEDWDMVSYEEPEGYEQAVLSPEFTASALVDALHDSPSQANHAERCFPGTQTLGKHHLSDWLTKHSPRNSHPCKFNLLWVHGPIGVGKTTLMRTLANALLPPTISSTVSVSGSTGADTEPLPPLPTYESQEFGTAGIQYGGAALFFSKQHQLVDAAKFFTTLAYGLARRLSPVAGFIQSAFTANQAQYRHPERIPFKNQAQTLILDPIKAWVESEGGDVDIDFVIIIDGFDECGSNQDKEKQREIVQAVGDVFTEQVDGVRWSWVFSSGTDARLYEVFVGGDASEAPKAEEVVLGLSSEPEMDTFIEGAVSRIRKTHPVFQNFQSGSRGIGDAGASSAQQPVGEEWPSSQDLATIKWQAAGLYAAASPILDYVANPTDDPRKRLLSIENFIGTRDPARFQYGSDHPYSKLDAAYRDVLTRIPLDSREETRRILGAISCLQPSTHDQHPPTITELANLLDIQVDEVHKLLYDLHSVICGPLTRPIVRQRIIPTLEGNLELTFHHHSFEQFLRTPARSLDWGLDLEMAHADLARCCLRKLSTGHTGPSGELPRKRWYVHCWRTGKDTEAALGLLPELFEFDFSVLGESATVDRWFVEWLLHLQETTMSEYQLLNLGPFIELDIIPLPDPDLDPRSSGTSTPTTGNPRERARKLPARQSYILGLEPARQVYLVPYYDVKVQWRADLGQVVGPKEKYWDWIRGFRVVQRDFAERRALDELIGAGEVARWQEDWEVEIQEGESQATMRPSRRDEGGDDDDEGGLYA